MATFDLCKFIVLYSAKIVFFSLSHIIISSMQNRINIIIIIIVVFDIIIIIFNNI